MKLEHLFVAAALSATAAGPTLAAEFVIDFEKTWDAFGDNLVNEYYNGGTASDGSSGPNFGVSFVGMTGFSNTDGTLGYANAISPEGIGFPFAADEGSFMNVAAGVSGLDLFYSSPFDTSIKAYSGLNGTGELLGTLNLAANIAENSIYDEWGRESFIFNGIARSFDFGDAALNLAVFDNIIVSAVPLPPAVALLGSALLAIPGLRRKSSQA